MERGQEKVKTCRYNVRIEEEAKRGSTWFHKVSHQTNPSLSHPQVSQRSASARICPEKGLRASSARHQSTKAFWSGYLELGRAATICGGLVWCRLDLHLYTRQPRQQERKIFPRTCSVTFFWPQPRWLLPIVESL